MQNSKIVVVIPTYNPTSELTNLVREIKKAGLTTIVIVNDGSTTKESVDLLNQLEEVILLSHPSNKGKGAALKTGLGYLSKSLPSCTYALCCDDDGQHSFPDIVAVSKTKTSPSQVVFGSRLFDKDVPLKSLIGNRLTSFLFYLFFRKKIHDTQTGLRLIPRQLFADLTAITQNRFEFELACLIYFLKKGFLIKEVPIETIYFDNNKNTKFKSFSDSWLVLKTLFSQFF